MKRVLIALFLLGLCVLATPRTVTGQNSEAVSASGGGGGAALDRPLRAGDMVRLGFWLDRDVGGDVAVNAVDLHTRARRPIPT